MVEDIFKKTIQSYGLVEKKDRILLGGSGGPDSLFMLHQFCAIREQLKLTLTCGHFNHGLRPEADAEEQFLRKGCKKLDIAFISQKKEVRKFFDGDSLEQTARNLRYDFFITAARQLKYKKLAFAHHRDDLVETILMRLIRGAGLRGLRGFLPLSRYRGLKVIRPLIEMKKTDILSWLKQEKIPYCVDASNFDEAFLRNRIRHSLLPALAQLNPNISDALYNAARVIASDYEIIHAVSSEAYHKALKRQTARQVHLDLACLEAASRPLLNNIMRVAISELQGHIRRLESRHFDELYDLVAHRPNGSVVDLPNLFVRKEQASVILESRLL